MAVFMLMPGEMLAVVAKQAQEKRLTLNYSQQTLATRSGVSFGVIKKFERTGKISLESLLKLALALGCLEDFKNLFIPKIPEYTQSLDEILKQKHKPRKRGRL